MTVKIIIPAAALTFACLISSSVTSAASFGLCRHFRNAIGGSDPEYRQSNVAWPLDIAFFALKNCQTKTIYNGENNKKA